MNYGQTMMKNMALWPHFEHQVVDFSDFSAMDFQIQPAECS